MASGNDEYIVDQLLTYLNNPLFQAPIDNFMDSNCIVFDPSQEDCESYLQLHKAYKNLIDTLLEGFRQDTGLTPDKIICSLKAVNKRPEIRDVYRNICDQVIAMDDFNIFVQLMTQRNIEIQHQALLLIIQQTGGLPDSLLEGETTPVSKSQTDDEEEILRQVMEQSRQEYEAQAHRRKQEEEEFEMVLRLSQQEAARLDAEMKVQQEKTKEMMKKMSLDTAPKSASGSSQPIPKVMTTPPSGGQSAVPTDMPPLPKAAPAAAAVTAATAKPPSASQPKADAKSPPLTAAPGLPATRGPSSAPMPAGGGGGVSSAEAASMWMQSAKQEASASPAVRAMAASMSGMSAEEMKKREAFLKQQRDKLVELKRKEREKQLLRAEASQPQRPVSARLAKAAMDNSGSSAQSTGVDPEEEKKLAMRRAIANRIKTELMGKK